MFAIHCLRTEVTHYIMYTYLKSLNMDMNLGQRLPETSKRSLLPPHPPPIFASLACLLMGYGTTMGIVKILGLGDFKNILPAPGQHAEIKAFLSHPGLYKETHITLFNVSDCYR